MGLSSWVSTLFRGKKEFKPLKLDSTLTIHHSGVEEAKFLYGSIFESDEYLKGGITINEGDTVFDVGANIGMFMMFVHRHTKGTARMVCLEPMPQLCTVLRRNAESVNWVNQKPLLLEAGASTQVGSATFSFMPNYTVLSGMEPDPTPIELDNFISLLDLNLYKSSSFFMRILRFVPRWPRRWILGRLVLSHMHFESCACKLTTLSQVLRDMGPKAHIDLLKVDVEKAEMLVLGGIEEQDWARIKQVAVEVHDVDGRVAAIKELLTKQGFRLCHQTEHAPPRFLAYKLLGVEDIDFVAGQPGEQLVNLYAVRDNWKAPA